MKKTIKLLASSRVTDDGVIAMVAPHLVNGDDPLYSVNGVFNAIFVHGNMLGDAMFYGQGAGKEATASAVVADVIEEAQCFGTGKMSEWSPEKQELLDVSETKKRYFVRFQGDASDLTEAECCFGKVNAVVAPLAGEFGFTTGVMTEKEYQACAAKTDRVISMLRVREK